MVAALLAFVPSTAAHPDKQAGSEPVSKSCDAKSVAFHRHRARTILRHAYRSEPSRSEIEAYQSHRRCIRDKDIRKSLAALRHRLKAALEQRQLAASVTPYPGPNGTHWAIPWYVVDCESHGDWGAYNASSGATGPYQMLPSTYGGVCDTCDWSQPDQHLAASRVWARSGGGEWSCA